MNIKNIVWVLICFCAQQNILGQNLNQLEINQCLIYGNLFDGLSIIDTNQTITILYRYRVNRDSTIVQFDEKGRIKNTKTALEKCSYEYLKGKIIKKVKTPIPPRGFKCNEYSIEYILDDKQKIQMSLLKCDSLVKESKYVQSNCSGLTVVDIFVDNKLSSQEIFIYNENEDPYFQWETKIISPHSLFFNYYKSKYLWYSNLKYLCNSTYTEISNKSIIEEKHQIIQDRYAILDSNKNEIGEIMIKRAK